MIEVGRLCLKTAGRDAGRHCVIVKCVDDNYVLVDGQTRRRKCNISHLEPLQKKISLKEEAAHSEVVKELKKLNIVVDEKKKASKEKTPKPVKARKRKAAPAEPTTKKTK
jgi:large subunit ribosomal protein L14e